MPTPVNNSPAQIFNEGRVVGLSAYELYVQQHLAEHPDIEAASELEWLASSLGSGAALILKVPAGSVVGDYLIVSVTLPRDSALAACSTIVASYFDGEVELDTSGLWATKVTKYSGAFRNDTVKYPGNSTAANNSLNPSSVDAADVTPSAAHIERLKQYMKIIDGVVIQSGTWTAVSTQPPYRDLKPSFSTDLPEVRLVVRGQIDEDPPSVVTPEASQQPLILLTGFTSKYVTIGCVDVDGSTSTQNPQDGDFLGPSVFPWASKIIFSVPNEYIQFMVTTDYKRQITASSGYTQDASAHSVDMSPIIDMSTVNPRSYYDQASSALAGAAVDTNVSRVTYPKDGAAVLTVYSRKVIYPPALYAAYITGSGNNQKLYPLDVVAPGSVKLFQTSGNTSTDIDTLKNYQAAYPGTFALLVDDEGTLHSLLYDGQDYSLSEPFAMDKEVPIIQNINASGVIKEVTGGLYDPSATPPRNPVSPRVVTESYGHFLLDMSDPSSSATTALQLIMSARPTNCAHLRTDLTWATLLYALFNNFSIDILGDRLREMTSSLLEEMVSGQTAPYITFGTGSDAVRLYVSKTPPDPDDAPEGSIGFGW